MKLLYNKTSKKLLTLFTLGCFLIAGCSAPKDQVTNSNHQSAESPTANTVYRVMPSNRTTSQWENAYGVVSHDGRMIIPFENQEVYLISDQLTKEQLWIQTSTRIVDDPTLSAQDFWKEENFGKVHFQYTLYDLDGNMVKSLGENGIMSVYGDLVLYYNGQLVDKNTGEVYYNDVNTINQSGEYYVMNTKNYAQVRVMDHDRNVIYETAGGLLGVDDQYYISAEQIQADGSRLRAVHRLDGTEIIPYGYDYFSTAVVNNAQYILAERDGYEYVFSLLDGSLIYEENTPDPEYDYVQYFMKDCMIIQHREVVATAENGGWPIYGYYSQLYHYDGTPFGEKYRNIYPLNDVYRTMAAKDANAEMLFHATTQNGVEAVINQAGEVIFEVPDNGWVTVLNEDRIIKNDYDTNIASLCDGQGNSLTEKDYSYMHTMYMEDATGSYIGANLLNASYTIAGKTMYDLLDFDGNVLVERAKNIQTLSPDRFWVEKGFYQGLMDRDGNWLYKQSVFDSAVDE